MVWWFTLLFFYLEIFDVIYTGMSGIGRFPLVAETLRLTVSWFNQVHGSVLQETR